VLGALVGGWAKVEQTFNKICVFSQDAQKAWENFKQLSD